MPDENTEQAIAAGEAAPAASIDAIASTPSSDTAADSIGAPDNSTGNSLLDYFKAQADESGDEDVPDDSDTDVSSEEGDAAATAATGDKPAEDSATNTDADITTADFDALEAKPPEPKEYLDLDGLKAKYPRNASKELLQETADALAEAKKGSEIIERLGGEAFVEPLAKIQKGIAAGDSQSFFAGVLEGGSIEAVRQFTGHSLVLSLITSQQWLDDPELAANSEVLDNARAMQENVNQVLKARFGEDISIETIDSMSALVKNGWIESLQKWKEQGFVDHQEWEDLLEGDENPAEFQSLKQKNKELEEKLQQATAATAAAAAPEKTAAAPAQITDSTTSALLSDAAPKIERVFTEIVLAKSVLRAVAGDSDEMKSQKELLRSIVSNDALAAFTEIASATDEKGNSLARAYNRGEAQTIKFQTSLTDAINKAILQTKAKTNLVESIVAKLYGQTRNGKLAAAQQTKNNSGAATAAAQPTLEPTQTQEPVRDNEPSAAKTQKTLQQFFELNG